MIDYTSAIYAELEAHDREMKALGFRDARDAFKAALGVQRSSSRPGCLDIPDLGPVPEQALEYYLI